MPRLFEDDSLPITLGRNAFVEQREQTRTLRTGMCFKVSSLPLVVFFYSVSALQVLEAEDKNFILLLSSHVLQSSASRKYPRE